jgi:FkbM family methyltransferase
MWREMDAFLTLTRGRARLLDVGAHYGVFSLAFAANGGEAVVAVEPFPKAFAVLARHAELNPAAAIRAEPVALGDRPGRVWMRADEFHLAATPDETEARAGGLEVPVTTVDALITDLGFRPDTLKIDVEGYEVHVLEGARGLLQETGPLIFLEVHPDHIRQLGRSVEELVKLMAGSGYEFFDARGRPITDVPRHLAGGIRRVVCRKAAGG